MKILFFTIPLFLFSITQAQNKGIHFEHNSNWEAIVAKAKTENKYILVDCFTTWCAPCKYMDTNIFPLQKVGAFFNDNFINVKFQFDSTVNDAEEIKNQYADAALLLRKYHIEAYPTFLFFNPNGELVHRELGGSNANEFITNGQNALNPQKQYYTQAKMYEKGRRDSAFLRNLIQLAVNAGEDSAASNYTKEYISVNPNTFSTDNMHLLYENTRTVYDTGFSLMVNNIGRFISIVDKEKLFSSLKTIILRSEFSSGKNWDSWNTKQWDKYAESLRKAYPLFAEDVLFRIQTVFYLNKNNWQDYTKTVEKYSSRKSPSPIELNGCAWSVFRRCDDPKILKKALLWSKKSFTKQVKIDPSYMDTYANILYKLGKKDEAIEWERKAQKIAVEQGKSKNWGEKIINKMSQGEKTW